VQSVTIELTKKLNVFGTACLTSCYYEVLSHYTLKLILNELKKWIILEQL